MNLKNELPEADLNAIYLELDNLIKEISYCDSFESASLVLKECGDFQEKLCVLSFKSNVRLPVRLYNIVAKFDRWDDEYTRRSFYDDARNNKL